MTFPSDGCDLNFLGQEEDGCSHCMLTAFFLWFEMVAPRLIACQNLKICNALSGSTVNALAVVPYAVACNCTTYICHHVTSIYSAPQENTKMP
jgi:hypothetical protein